MNVKHKLYKQCLEFVENRLQVIQNTIQDLQKSLLSETKSTAGDKHETGRAMLQLEREKAGNQLAEIQKVKEVLYKIDVDKTTETVRLGSLVYTSKLNYFIAISAGEVEFNEGKFFAISPSTPIAKTLLSKKAGDKVTFRTTTFTITRVE